MTSILRGFGPSWFSLHPCAYDSVIRLHWFEASFGLSIVFLSMHHVVLGFGRTKDGGGHSLISMPTGLIVTGTQLGDLVMVLMLLLAALTLIGQ